MAITGAARCILPHHSQIQPRSNSHKRSSHNQVYLWRNIRSTKRIPPDDAGPIATTDYIYSTFGQLLRKTSTDGATFGFSYDKAGHLIDDTVKVTVDGVESVDQIIHSNYDAIGRLTEIHAIRGTVDELCLKNYYDNTTQLVNNPDFSNFSPEIFPLLNLLRGRLAATITWNRTITRRSVPIIDLFSYDRFGRVSSKYRSIPSMPVQQTSFIYDVHGKLITETTQTPAMTMSKVYSFDNMGRFKAIKEVSTNKDIVRYQYDNLGTLTNKNIVLEDNTTRPIAYS
jgi:YD repeat-containing protein